MEEVSKLRYFLAPKRKMIGLAKAVRVTSLSLKELVIHIHVQVNGHAGPIGASVGPMVWCIDNEDAKTPKPTYCQVKSRIVEMRKVTKKKVVDLL